MNGKKNYRNEYEKLGNFEQKCVKSHFQVVTVCIAWFQEEGINFTTTELLKMVELANAELARGES